MAMISFFCTCSLNSYSDRSTATMHVTSSASNSHKGAMHHWTGATAKRADSFNCWACLIGSQGEAITHDRAFILVLSLEKRAWLDWGGAVWKGRRGVSTMLAELEKEAGVQPAPQPNPSPGSSVRTGTRGWRRGWARWLKTHNKWKHTPATILIVSNAWHCSPPLSLCFIPSSIP